MTGESIHCVTWKIQDAELSFKRMTSKCTHIHRSETQDQNATNYYQCLFLNGEIIDHLYFFLHFTCFLIFYTYILFLNHYRIFLTQKNANGSPSLYESNSFSLYYLVFKKYRCLGFTLCPQNHSLCGGPWCSHSSRSLKSSPHDSNAQPGNGTTCLGWVASILQPFYLQHGGASCQYKWKNQCVIHNSIFMNSSWWQKIIPKKKGTHRQLYTWV